MALKFPLGRPLKKITHFIFGFAFVMATVLSPSIVAVSDASMGAFNIGGSPDHDRVAGHVISLVREASDSKIQ